MALGDARISALHQASELEEPGCGVVCIRIIRTAPSSGSFAALGGRWCGGPRLRAVVHGNTVHPGDS